jgi:hypothetical protein
MTYVLFVLGYLATIAAVAAVRTGVKSWQPKLRELHVDVGIIVAATVALVVGIRSQYLADRAAERQARQLEALTRYGEVAHMNEYGETMPIVHGGLLVQRGPVIDALQGAWTASPDKNDLWPVCDENGVKKFSTVATNWPDAPWGHFGLTLCSLCVGDPTWRDHAERAREIFRATIQIAGHHPDHDAALATVEKLLASGFGHLEDPFCPKNQPATKPAVAN